MSEEKKSAMERLETDLDFNPDEKPRVHAREGFTASQTEVGSAWKEEPVKPRFDIRERAESALSHSPFFRKVLFFSVGFFVLALAVALITFFGGFNSVSSKKIDIAIDSLIAVSGGEEAVFKVTVKNNNRVLLEDAELLVEYPPGVRKSGDVSVELTRTRESMGDIPAGGTAEKTVRAVFFGEKEEVKKMIFTLEYKARGSNAVFSKDKEFDVTISSSAVIVDVKYPSEVSSNEEIPFLVEVSSNSQTTLENLLLTAEYPFGFAFASADPVPLAGNHTWKIGSLKPREKKTIRIVGRVEAAAEEERTFRFNVGTAHEDDDEKIGVPLVISPETIRIKRPFINLSLELNGQSAQVVSSLGSRVSGTLEWTNILPVDINNATIEIALSGAALDRESIKLEQSGFYRSVDNTIVWDQGNTAALRRLAPGSNGSVSFSFGLLKKASVKAGDPAVTLEVTMKGTRFSEAGLPEQISAVSRGTVKLGADIRLTPQAVYSTGPFKNTGPIPPKADKETTYTIIMPIVNSFASASGVTVSGTLPSYVRFTGAVSPAGERVIYNESARTVTWHVGSLPAGGAVREAAFQVALVPSIQQAGTAPTLFENVVLIGQTADQKIDLRRPNVTTRMSTDPQFDIGDENVIR